MSKHPILLSPIAITPKCVLKNRMIKSPQSSWLWNKDGTAEDSAAIDMYESMAKGGASAIIVAALLWEPAAPGIYLHGYDDKYIPGMKQLTDRVHRHDCKLFAQIHHMGPAAWSTPNNEAPIGPSTLSVDEIPLPPPFVRPTRGLTVDEIHEKQRLMLEAAIRAQKGGFDGVEVHAAHAYFLNSFLSPIWNRRDDEYGCQNVENRTRIIREIFAAIREACGPDFVIGTRINGQEFGAKGGITIEDAIETAKALEAAGAQYMNVAGYGYGPLPFRYCPDYFPYPEPEEFMKPFMPRYEDKGLWNEPGSRVKKAVHIPVITAGRMDEDLAERVLRDGDADIIGLGRTLWADPEFPNKVKEERFEDIVRCTRCSSCNDPVTAPRICRVNPSLGREKELAVVPAARRKKVMVVGGGPAGMEAARVAALRGHDVSIWDKEPVLGGRVKLASMIKGSNVENVLPIHDYLTTQIRKLGIAPHLGAEVTADVVRREKPDAVILATSSPYAVPDIPGIRGRNVSTIKALAGKVKLPMRVFGPKMLEKLTHWYLPVGRRVVVLGGQIEGLQGAVFLRKRGRQVTVIEESATIGAGIPELYFCRMIPWFKEKGVDILTETKAESIGKDGVTVRTKDGKTRMIPADSVMVLMPQVPDPALEKAIKPLVGEVHVIGSALGAANGLLKHALLDGRRAGCQV